MADKFDEEILTFQNSLHYTHGSQALNMLILASQLTSRPTNWIERHQAAVSSIIHGFCWVESVVNLAAHHVFHESTSKHFVPLEQRSFPLRKAIQSWKFADLVDRIQIVLESGKKQVVADKTLSELRELNQLRNWLVHGFTFESVILLDADPDQENVRIQIDREDSIDWRRKFPNLKFNSLDLLDASDARTALLTALTTIQLIVELTGWPLILASYVGKPHFTFVDASPAQSANQMLDRHLLRLSQSDDSL